MTGQTPDSPPVTDATVRDEPPPRTGYAARAGIVVVSAAILGSALGGATRSATGPEPGSSGSPPHMPSGSGWASPSRSCSRPRRRSRGCSATSSSDQPRLLPRTERGNGAQRGPGYPYAVDYLGDRELTLGRGRTILDRGRPLDTDYLAVDSRVPVAGSKLVRVELSALRPDNFPHGASLTLWHVDKPARLDFQGPLRLTPRPDGQPCS